MTALYGLAGTYADWPPAPALAGTATGTGSATGTIRPAPALIAILLLDYDLTTVTVADATTGTMGETMPYMIGAPRVFQATFATATGPADPTALKVVVEAPSGAFTTYTYGVDAALVRLGPGVYALTLVPIAAGTWRMKWTSTGAAAGGALTSFLVPADGFPYP